MNRGGVFKVTRSAFRSSVGGLLALSAVNLSAAITGISLGFSCLSGAVAILLGIPGVVGLLLTNALFIM